VKPGRAALGRAGEDLAVAHLLKAGYEIVERNVRTRYGEIDVVARDGQCLVFVEVRTMASSMMTPEESVTARKQQRVAELGMAYLIARQLADADWRADVVAIEMGQDGRPARLDHHVNAIEA